jgi:hypothetical protein
VYLNGGTTINASGRTFTTVGAFQDAGGQVINQN